jgi:hypothetical protein
MINKSGGIEFFISREFGILSFKNSGCNSIIFDIVEITFYFDENWGENSSYPFK